MAWKEAFDGRSLEQMRVLIEFQSPLPNKALERCAESLNAEYSNLKFDQMERVPSSIQNLVMLGANQQPQQQSNLNGYVFRRTRESSLLEEVGLRDKVFGFF